MRVSFSVLLGLAAAAAIPSGAGFAAAATTRGNLDRPPYYDGKPKTPVRPAAHVPVRFRDEPGSLDPTPDRSPALAATLDSLRAAIEGLGITTAIALDPREKGGPDVRFGARRGGTGADGTPRASGEVDPAEPRRMEFEVETPSRAWRDRVRALAGDSVRAVVVLQLGFADWWVRQKNWKGAKGIDLGQGRTQDLPWLTSLDDPVQVLVLTGALVSPEGRVLRVGAEGLLARRTGMTASVLGAQETLTEEDLGTLLSPGAEGEPVWRVALRRLVTGLIDPATAR